MNRLKRRRRRLALVGLLLLMIGSVVLLQLRIAPTLRRIAENQVVNAASDAIFRAVARQLQTGSVDYSRIIGLEKDETGRITCPVKAAPFQSRASTAGAILITAPYILSSHELFNVICG